MANRDRSPTNESKKDPLLPGGRPKCVARFAILICFVLTDSVSTGAVPFLVNLMDHAFPKRGVKKFRMTLKLFDPLLNAIQKFNSERSQFGVVRKISHCNFEAITIRNYAFFSQCSLRRLRAVVPKI